MSETLQRLQRETHNPYGAWYKHPLTGGILSVFWGSVLIVCVASVSSLWGDANDTVHAADRGASNAGEGERTGAGAESAPGDAQGERP